MKNDSKVIYVYFYPFKEEKIFKSKVGLNTSKQLRVCYLTDIFESNFLRDRPMLTHLLAKRGYDVLAVSSTYLNGKLLKKSLFQKWDKTVYPARVVRAKTLKIQRVYSPPIILFFPL